MERLQKNYATQKKKSDTLKLRPFPRACLCRFSAVQKHTVEFNQLAMANSEGSEAMLNRVMTKDNIGVAVLLEVRKEMMEVSCECTPPQTVARPDQPLRPLLL